MHTYILIHNINDRLLYFTGAYKESREGGGGWGQNPPRGETKESFFG